MRPLSISDMNFEGLIDREWIVTNGLGGYASSTLCGMNTRKYHGLLVAAMTPPVRRMVLLSHVEETVWTNGGEYALGNNEYPGTIFPKGFVHLRAFHVEPFPRWAYQGDGFTIEKSLRLLKGENTACLSYSLLAGEKPVTLEIKALLALRGIHELMYQWNSRLSAESKRPGLVRIPASARTPEVFFAHDGEFRAEPHWHLNTIYRREEERGYSGLEDLWKPGSFQWKLSPGQTVHLACSTEPLELARVLGDLQRAREDLDRQTAIVTTEVDGRVDTLLRAAESFVVSLPTEAEGKRSVFVDSQYPWGAPSGRAALVGFGGLFLATERIEEGRDLLFGLAAQMRHGMIPTEFAENGEGPSFQGADTSLWFINAAGEYLQQANDDASAGLLFAAVEGIIESYGRGSAPGIVCDSDGLVGARAPGKAVSWMDAQVADWVVTPRQGRTVELNALWYNALVTGSRLALKLGRDALAAEWNALAEKARDVFNRRFWNEKLNCCYDVVDDHGYDASIRPNQIFAVSLPNAVLALDRQKAVVQKVIEELLTPMGVRTLSRRDPAYQAHYAGNVVARERAQHQGSAYPWLLGPLATAYLKANGRDGETVATVLQWLRPCIERLEGDGLGVLCELFDGDAPQVAKGALSSALSAAEMLRCYTREAIGISTARRRTPTASPRTSESPAGQPTRN